MAAVLALLLLPLTAQVTLVGWEVTPIVGAANFFGASPFAPTTIASNITGGSLIRGSGIGTTGGTGASSAWGGNNILAVDQTAAEAANEFVTLSLTANAGYIVDLSEFHLKNVRRSSSGANAGTLQYRIYSGTPSGTFIGLHTWAPFGGGTGSAGNALAAVSLTGLTVDPGETIEFRIVLWGGTTTTGTWYVNGNPAAPHTGDDLIVTGTIIAPPNAIVGQTTGGVAVSPLAASSTDHALIGFSILPGNVSTITGLTFVTSSNTSGVLTNLRIYQSPDGDYATPGDNVLVTGGTYTQNPTNITITGLTINLTLAETYFFLVADVTGSVSGATPSVQLSLSDAGFFMTPGGVDAFSFSGDVYSFLGSGSPLLVASAVSPAFGNVCINPALPPTGSFTLEGTDLDPGQDVVIGPLPGFDFFDVNIPDYAPTLTLSHSGTISEVIDVRFQPTLVQSYDGAIPVTGGDADPTSAAVTGAGINTAATVTTGAVSGVTTTEATVGGSYGDIGCSDVTAFGVEYSTDPASSRALVRKWRAPIWVVVPGSRT